MSIGTIIQTLQDEVEYANEYLSKVRSRELVAYWDGKMEGLKKAIYLLESR